MKVLNRDGQVYEGNFEEAQVQAAFWHTSAHVLAQAVKRLYPATKCAIGPAIEHGFYYDFEFDFSFTEEHLQKLEEEMKRIVKESLSLQVYEVEREEALAYMEKQNESYKVEMIRELPADEAISFYKQGEYTEFCAGPHIVSTSYIRAIKLLSVAGAYWRGDEKNKMLTRIYGISFPKAAELEQYLAYAREVAQDLQEQGVRVEIDERGEKLGYKIREARLDKVPYILILGEKEMQSRTVSVRCRDAEADKQDLGAMSLREFIELVRQKMSCE